MNWNSYENKGKAIPTVKASKHFAKLHALLQNQSQTLTGLVTPGWS